MNYLNASFKHFTKFHKGTVNIVLHVVGFLGIFYSIFRLNCELFALSLIVLELGHVYNHVVGIEKYDTRPKVLLWRAVIFLALVVGLYLIRTNI